VFAAKSTAGVDAAIKLMHTHMADDPVHAQRFYREARIASGLTHPNTVRVFDWGHASSGQLFLVMERLHGHELQDEIDACDYLDPVRGAQIAIQALGALAEAHEAGVVHLDVKPGNLFVCEDDHIKVIDFGIARKMDPDDDPEPLSELLGREIVRSRRVVERSTAGVTSMRSVSSSIDAWRVSCRSWAGT